MGKQVNFFMDAQDESEFAKVVVGDENVVFIPQVSDTTPLPEFRHPVEANHMKHAMSLLIWNKAICERVTVQQHAPNNFSADIANTDPIIEFSRSFYHSRILVAGRLWAEMYALDETRKQLVHKGKDFEQWYNSLARWIRRHYKREDKYGFYAGPGAQRLLGRGEIELAQHLMEGGRPI